MICLQQLPYVWLIPKQRSILIFGGNYGLEPCSGSLFNSAEDDVTDLKAFLWEEDGFLMLYKRLDNGGFQWPRSESGGKAADTGAIVMADAGTIH